METASIADDNRRAQYDTLITTLADYTAKPLNPSPLALETAHWCLWDALGCAMLALRYPECNKLIGPWFNESQVSLGASVPGTRYILDPMQAAFAIGTTIRWLDYNDTWLAQEWGHPSDNLGAILACAEYQSIHRQARGLAPFTMKDVLHMMIKAYEIQGVLALENSFNRVGLDHVILVKLASTAVATSLLGGNREQLLAAISQVWLDGNSLRTYRHSPNTGSRKSWAAGDATSRAVRLAAVSLAGEMGYPSVLSVPKWGFSDALFREKPLKLARELDCYVMENILFKIAYPAEFHAQTAVECAIALHPEFVKNYQQIEKIQIETQDSAIRIISKQGPLHNPADRDHCLQYMVAVGLLYGELTADHYSDEIAADPRIDDMRNKMLVSEHSSFSEDYYHPEKRSIANALQIFYRDGSSSKKVCVEYPLGHRQRRAEGNKLLQAKLERNLATRFPKERLKALLQISQQPAVMLSMTVPEFMQLWQI